MSNDHKNEIIAAATEPHTDGDLLKKLVIAIIKANPNKGGIETDKERMNAAMTRLIGSRYHADRKTSGTVEALEWMAEQYIKDRGGPGVSPGKDHFAWLEIEKGTERTVKQLAEAASVKFPFSTSDRNLQNQFTKRGKSICKAVVMGSDIPGTLHNQALHNIKEILEPFGVSMKLDPE